MFRLIIFCLGERDEMKKSLNLYLISQSVNCEYDTYDSAVVCAETEEKARLVNPDGSDDWDGKKESGYGDWCDARDVKVTLIGTAMPNIKGVVCASFNAG